MKKKNVIAVIAGFIFYFLLRGIIFPYDNQVAHKTFNEYVVKFAEEYSQKFFPSNYRINITADDSKYKGIAVTEGGFFSISEGETDSTILNWIVHGGYSADEPEVAAAVRHFYDPVKLVGVKYLTNEGTSWEHYYTNPHIDAIEWAIGDTPNGAENKWTLLKGKEYLIEALEIIDEETKNTDLAKAFRCLGEVLHNTGDMGCPPHTRNDSHAAPKFFGLPLGSIFGSPDPYEEMFLPSFIPTYWKDAPDPDLKSFCDNATTVRSINEKLAEFTNVNFFTKETINGVGKGTIYPINKEGIYSHPLLQDFEYNSDDFTYYKILPYNNFKIVMLKDKGYWESRTYPYLDRECVRNQAEYLIPNIICAGANILRLFIPILQVQIKSVDSKGEIKGTVTHIPNAEYSSLIKYSGKIDIYDSKSLEKIGKLNCVAGSFSGTIPGLITDDEIYANLEIGGININSDNYKVGEVELVIKGCSILLTHLKGNFTKDVAGVTETLENQDLSLGFPKDTDTARVTFSKNDLTLIQQYENHPGGPGDFFSEKIVIKFGNKSLDYVSSISAEWEYTRNTTSVKNRLEASSIPRDNTVSNIKFNLSGQQVCSKIISVSRLEDYTTWTYSLQEGSQTCTSDSKIEIFIFAE